jgi:hypothetical protein
MPPQWATGRRSYRHSAAPNSTDSRSARRGGFRQARLENYGDAHVLWRICTPDSVADDHGRHHLWRPGWLYRPSAGVGALHAGGAQNVRKMIAVPSAGRHKVLLCLLRICLLHFGAHGYLLTRITRAPPLPVQRKYSLRAKNTMELLRSFIGSQMGHIPEGQQDLVSLLLA